MSKRAGHQMSNRAVQLADRAVPVELINSAVTVNCTRSYYCLEPSQCPDTVTYEVGQFYVASDHVSSSPVQPWGHLEPSVNEADREALPMLTITGDFTS
ncbi:hypothetical protein BaRGS_00013850 [Batillaria attramentaria]|uniref:Uncharacterized protein n=1 Tax=Batillaria attramentaria TaxID=370345 RepID=A0ABD0L6R0_9CAEN